MLHFVFDLDYTLYQTQGERFFDYSQIKENKYLDFLLGIEHCFCRYKGISR